MAQLEQLDFLPGFGHDEEQLPVSSMVESEDEHDIICESTAVFVFEKNLFFTIPIGSKESLFVMDLSDAFNIFSPSHLDRTRKWVIYPAPRLKRNVPDNLQMARSKPSCDTLRKNISGSIEGDASQKDITGAMGTPLISRAEIIGITPHEQNGLIAPTSVASKMAISGLALNAFPI